MGKALELRLTQTSDRMKICPFRLFSSAKYVMYFWVKIKFWDHHLLRVRWCWGVNHCWKIMLLLCKSYRNLIAQTEISYSFSESDLPLGWFQDFSFEIFMETHLVSVPLPPTKIRGKTLCEYKQFFQEYSNFVFTHIRKRRKTCKEQKKSSKKRS